MDYFFSAAILNRGCSLLFALHGVHAVAMTEWFRNFFIECKQALCGTNEVEPEPVKTISILACSLRNLASVWFYICYGIYLSLQAEMVQIESSREQ